MNRLTVNLVAAALVVTTFSACTIGGDYHSAYEDRQAAQQERQDELRKLQAKMSSAEKKAITETCMKELNNQGQGATGSLGGFLAAQENCEISYSK
jgi:hypothetical protein